MVNVLENEVVDLAGVARVDTWEAWFQILTEKKLLLLHLEILIELVDEHLVVLAQVLQVHGIEQLRILGS